MSFIRVNHNLAAMNSHRNLQKQDRNLTDNFQKISSGVKIDRSSDSPAAFVTSESMRSQIAGIDKALVNSNSAVSMLQTAEGALNEVNNILIRMRSLSISSANEGLKDEMIRAADQAEITNSLDAIDRIARNTQFGTLHLLNGNAAVSGTITGDSLTFVSATPKTETSPEGGYEIKILESPAPAQSIGKFPLTEDIIDSGEKLTVVEGGKYTTYRTQQGETLSMIKNKMQDQIDNAGLNLKVDFTDDSRMVVTHKFFGSNFEFQVMSDSAGVLSDMDAVPKQINNGRDIVGTIGGENAIGRGRYLEGAPETKVDGLKIRFSPDENNFGDEFILYHDLETGETIKGKTGEGLVTIDNKALKFQLGSNDGQLSRISLNSIMTDHLGQNVKNLSGFRNLREIDLTTTQGASDALGIIDRAIREISITRGKLGSVQKNTIEANISNLSTQRGNLADIESKLRDTDMAKAISEFNRSQVMAKANMSLLSQANQISGQVVDLMY